MPTRTLLFAFILTICPAIAAAENVGTQPGGQVPGPNAAPAQPVPGAMPNSAAVPSTISEKNAREDKLPVAAFRLKNLNDDQRQAIYRSVMANVQKSQPAAPSISTPVDVGTALPPNFPLNPLPDEVASRIPEVKNLQFGFSGDKLILADPVYHEVFAVIQP